MGNSQFISNLIITAILHWLGDLLQVYSQIVIKDVRRQQGNHRTLAVVLVSQMLYLYFFVVATLLILLLNNAQGSNCLALLP